MTREMAEQMEGEDAARELAATCLASFDEWAEGAILQAGGTTPNDGREAARAAVAYLRSDLDDYLAHDLATALTALRLQGAL